MSRLIDETELKEWVENWFYQHKYYHPYSKSNSILCSELYDILERMPTIDAVEVVHCRDCKWLHIVNDNILYGFCTKGHAMFYPFQLDTREFFCADGRRKEQNDDTRESNRDFKG